MGYNLEISDGNLESDYKNISSDLKYSEIQDIVAA